LKSCKVDDFSRTEVQEKSSKNNIYTFSGNIHLPDPNCPIYWMGSSKKDLMALPLEVRKFFGHALDFGIALTKKANVGSRHPRLIWI